MASRPERPTRRALLLGAAFAGCGAVVPVVDAGVPPTGDGWTELPVPPALDTDGAAIVEAPLINVWVVRGEDGALTATWRVCTHGACDVEPVRGEGFVCPCHGSRFGVDGAVLTGPATRALRRFEVVRVSESLFLRRV